MRPSMAFLLMRQTWNRLRHHHCQGRRCLNLISFSQDEHPTYRLNLRRRLKIMENPYCKSRIRIRVLKCMAKILYIIFAN